MLKENMESQIGVLNRKSQETKDDLSRLSQLIEGKVKEIESGAKEQIEKLSAVLTNQEELVSSISNTETEITDLKAKIKAAEEEKSKLEESKSRLVTRNGELDNEIRSKEEEKANLENDLAKTNQELETTNQQIKETSEQLVVVEQEHGEKVGVHINEAQEIEERNKRLELKAKVLKHLFDTGYLVDPAYDILKRIGQPGIDDAKKLSLSANAQEGTVREILNELEKREVVSFDESSGKFTVLKKMEDLQ